MRLICFKSDQWFIWVLSALIDRDPPRSFASPSSWEPVITGAEDWNRSNAYQAHSLPLSRNSSLKVIAFFPPLQFTVRVIFSDLMDLNGVFNKLDLEPTFVKLAFGEVCARHHEAAKSFDVQHFLLAMLQWISLNKTISPRYQPLLQDWVCWRNGHKRHGRAHFSSHHPGSALLPPSNKNGKAFYGCLAVQTCIITVCVQTGQHSQLFLLWSGPYTNTVKLLNSK